MLCCHLSWVGLASILVHNELGGLFLPYYLDSCPQFAILIEKYNHYYFNVVILVFSCLLKITFVTQLSVTHECIFYSFWILSTQSRGLWVFNLGNYIIWDFKHYIHFHVIFFSFTTVVEVGRFGINALV